MFTPRSRARRASSLNFSSLCAIPCVSSSELSGGAGQFLLGLALRLRCRADDLRQHVGSTENQVLLVADLDLGASVLRKDDLVALGDVQRNELTRMLAPLARADREHAPALRLLLGGIREDDP